MMNCHRVCHPCDRSLVSWFWWRLNLGTFEWIPPSKDFWLVVWNINFIFPYIGNNHPNWRSYFSEGFKPPTRLKSDQFWVPQHVISPVRVDLNLLQFVRDKADAGVSRSWRQNRLFVYTTRKPSWHTSLAVVYGAIAILLYIYLYIYTYMFAFYGGIWGCNYIVIYIYISELIDGLYKPTMENWHTMENHHFNG